MTTKPITSCHPSQFLQASRLQSTLPRRIAATAFSRTPTCESDSTERRRPSIIKVLQAVLTTAVACGRRIAQFFSDLFVPVDFFYCASVPSRSQFRDFYALVDRPEERDEVARHMGHAFLQVFTNVSIREGLDNGRAGILTFRAVALMRMVVSEVEQSSHNIPTTLELRKRLMKLYLLDHPDKLQNITKPSDWLQLKYDCIWKLRDHLKDVTADSGRLSYLRKIIVKVSRNKYSSVLPAS